MRRIHPSTNFQAWSPAAVFVMTLKWATWDIEAKASPRNPYVVRWERSENEDNLEVVKRSASMGRSEFYWPEGLLTMSREKRPGGREGP